MSTKLKQRKFPFIKKNAPVFSNPTLPKHTGEDEDLQLNYFRFNANEIEFYPDETLEKFEHYKLKNEFNYWWNIASFSEKELNRISEKIDIHPLVQEDIFSKAQRPKIEEENNLLSCILKMMYYDDEKNTIEYEQISLVLGLNYVFSFQENLNRDLFNNVRERLNITSSKVRNNTVDYLFYRLLDAVIDNYYLILEKIDANISQIENNIIHQDDLKYTMDDINTIRREVIIFKQHIFPVKEIVAQLVRSENNLIHQNTKRYFNDLLDHIVQANEQCDSYRDLINNLRDLYFNQMNVKTNDAMKFLAIVTTLLAPSAVIGGVFGMNFKILPLTNHPHGFWITTLFLLLLTLLMIVFFKKKKWF
ncbi:MAG: magnesium/cobalt transporter CorA [Chitinophagaceae bacterium]|nr:magnesium/cobalt transporter CorA [Chitinophagaceae bacterium]